MRIRWFSNACVLISSNSGGSILCDPWVNPGANLGSWFHCPPVPTDYEDILFGLELDGIFISHLHSDHYDPKFISKFTRLRPRNRTLEPPMRIELMTFALRVLRPPIHHWLTAFIVAQSTDIFRVGRTWLSAYIQLGCIQNCIQIWVLVKVTAATVCIGRAQYYL